MPSGTFSKKARNVDTIINKKNCGGNKKAGLAPRATGPVEFRNVAFNTSPAVNNKVHQGGLPCPENYSNNPGGQCSGGVSPRSVTRGCGNLTLRFDISGNNNRFTSGTIHPFEINNITDPNHFSNKHTSDILNDRGLIQSTTRSRSASLLTTVNWSTTENILNKNMIGSPSNFNQAQCGCCYLYATTWAVLTLYNIKRAIMAGAIDPITSSVDQTLVPDPVVPNYQALLVGSGITGIGETIFNKVLRNFGIVNGGCDGGWSHWTFSVLANTMSEYGSGLISQTLGSNLGYKSNSELTRYIYNNTQCTKNCCNTNTICNNCATTKSYGCGLPAWASSSENIQIQFGANCNKGLTCLLPNPVIPRTQNTRTSGTVHTTDQTTTLATIFVPEFQPGFFIGSAGRGGAIELNDEGDLVKPDDATIGITILGARSDKSIFTNEHLKHYLTNIGPVPIVVDATNLMGLRRSKYWLTSANAIGPTPNHNINHMIQIVGYTTVTSNSPPPNGATVSPPPGNYWIVHNQWGSIWGLNNTCYVPMGNFPLDCFYQVNLMNIKNETIGSVERPTAGIINHNFVI